MSKLPDNPNALDPLELESAPEPDASDPGGDKGIDRVMLAAQTTNSENRGLINELADTQGIDRANVLYAAKLKSSTDEEAPYHWIHLDANAADVKSDLKKLIPQFDSLAIDAVLDRDARPRSLVEEEWSYLILRAVNFNEGEDTHDMIAIRVARGARFLVTLTYRDSRTIGRIAAIKPARLAQLSSGDLMVKIVNLVTDFKEAVIDQLQDQMDALEARVLDAPKVELRRQIVEIRKQAILLRRYIAPQKEAIGIFRKDADELISDKNRRSLADNWDTITRYLEDLDAVRERASVIKDELVNILSDRLNRNLYVISVITAIFLPLGFLTGLFGINIGGMPGTEDSDAFSFFVWVLIALVGIQIVLFKWFKWF